MRYKELLESDVAFAAPVTDQAAQPKAYFHVTTKRRLASIQNSGIEPNHKRRWKTGYGQQLGERGKVYVISDLNAAIRWAYKQQWEHFGGKEPDQSPYIILTVRGDPSAFERDPHPENSVYGNSFFQTGDTIAPEDIMKVIPLTRELIQQVCHLGESSLRGITSKYSVRKCVKALADRGWHESSSAPGMFVNDNYPEYYIELDVNREYKHNEPDGPFVVFKNNREIAVTNSPPYAQQLGLRDRFKPAEKDPWDITSLLQEPDHKEILSER